MFTGCTMFSGVRPRSTFSFNYKTEDNKTHKILIKSINDPGQEAYTIIECKEQMFKFTARDDGQNKIVDYAKGKFSKEKIQAIYDAGLRQAEILGRIRTNKWPFTYTYQEGSYIYEIRSYTAGTPRNVFFISRTFERPFAPLKAIDMERDGSIDEIVEGDPYSIGEIQLRYNKVLDAGIEEGRIIETDGIYLVETDTNPMGLR